MTTRIRTGRTRKHVARGRATNPRRGSATSVADVCAALENLAPLSLAQSWDNVGLLLGDRGAAVRRVLLCIDLTPRVVREAIRGRIDFVVAYHPPVFKPIQRLCADSAGAEACVFRCAQSGIAVYSPHTALDAATGGTNDVLAAAVGVRDARPLEYVGAPDGPRCKLVTFVPPSFVDRVADALFSAGAGRIGEYEKCSYRVSGRGTFWGGESTHPAVGTRGRFESVEEVRLETVVPEDRVPATVAALRAAHPYEEPAFDLYPLRAVPIGGIGRIGILKSPTSLSALARRLRRGLDAGCVQIVGERGQRLKRAILIAGAAGSLPFRAAIGRSDVVVTGEIRHHDALAIARAGAAAVALGHWASERPVLKNLAGSLRTQLPGIRIAVSAADADPFLPA